MTTIILGTITLLGEHDTVQTYIQFFALILSFLSAIAVIITLNLQRISIDNQSKINAIDIKLKLKEMTPYVDLIVSPHPLEMTKYQVFLEVSNANAIIHSFNFIEYFSFAKKYDVSFESYNVELLTTQYHFCNLNVIDDRHFEEDRIISMEPFHPERKHIKVELSYSDIYNLQTFIAEFSIKIENEFVTVNKIKENSIKQVS